jgi:hypothetical protein
VSRKKQKSQAKRRRKARLQTGVVGLSLSLAGAVCAESASADASSVAASAAARTLDLHEEEVIDVSLASFYLFDRENPGGPRADVRVAAKGGSSFQGAASASPSGNTSTHPSGVSPKVAPSSPGGSWGRCRCRGCHVGYTH